MQAKPRIKQRGMTLLEVLVALAVFSGAALAVIRAVTQHINHIGYLEQKTLASMVLDNQLSLLYLNESPDLSQRGSVEMGNQQWFWRYQQIETGNEMLKAVDVSVSLKQDHSSPIVTVRTYVSP